MKLKNWQYLGWIIFLTPFVIGVIGWTIAGAKGLDILFNAILFYMFQITDTPPNTWCQVARWMAPAMTIGAIGVAAKNLGRSLANVATYHFQDSVAVYGPSPIRERLLEQLGKRGIKGDKEFVRAAHYIFAGSQEENLSLFSDFRERIGSADVHIRCGRLSERTSGGNHVYLYSDEENAARLYWIDRSPAKEEALQANGYKGKIVFIGFDSLQEELLTFGLKNNVFDVNQKIEYHIFGDGKEYMGLHPQIREISDPVYFHEEAWYERPELMQEADRIIVSSNLDETLKILFAYPLVKVDLLTDADTVAHEIEHNDRIFMYPWEEEVFKISYILQEELLDEAKRVNMFYVNNGQKMENDPARIEEEWEKLDTFTKYSNVNAADYHQIQKMLLPDNDAQGRSRKQQIEDADVMENLAHLEHINWCRYHLLANWRLGTPEDGKNKDASRRIHTCLIPYEQLDEENKMKDRNTVKVMFALEEN